MFDRNIHIIILIFFAVFLCALAAMTIAREVLIPHMMPTATDGHIPGDPYYYHTIALEKAQQMHEEGIQTFELHLKGQGSAGIASLLYFLGGGVYSIVAMNAFLHGSSCIVMALIINNWFPLRLSLLSTLPLIISPHSIFWFSQINKDSYALSGYLLFLFGILGIIKQNNCFKKQLFYTLACIVGIFTIWIVRPYVNQILLPITAFLFLITIIIFQKNNLAPQKFSVAIGAVFILLSLFFLGRGALSDQTLESFNEWQYTLNQPKSIVTECYKEVDSRNWIDLELLPIFANNKIKYMMINRCISFLILNKSKNTTTIDSFIDSNFFPKSSLEAILYIPRAMTIGVLSPWPDRWLYVFYKERSFFYTIVPLEAALLYIGLVSLCIWLYRRREYSILIPVALSATVMTVYGMSMPFIGALYRYRYPWWMVLICLGLACLIDNYQSKSKKILENKP